MSDFEFVFVLYSLILGLSLVELLNGLGRTLEFKLARQKGDRAFSLGLLTPLLALFVILDLLSFWIFAWIVQDHVIAERFTVLGVLVFASAYLPCEPPRLSERPAELHRTRHALLPGEADGVRDATADGGSAVAVSALGLCNLR
ncbi:MAG: hypothetical protein O9293_05895 [Porphyrobacter sp.]|nr:hypothetical protein [Porphyrobacter sp.]